MTRFLLALMLTGLSSAAWGQTVCTPSCDNVLTLPIGPPLAQGTLPIDPMTMPMVPPTGSPDPELMTLCLHGCVLEVIPGLESNSYRHTRVLPHPYTLDEIDRMRVAIHAQFVKEHGQTFSCDMSGKSSGYCPETYPQASTIEDLLDTYMSQGVRPEELEAKVK